MRKTVSIFLAVIMIITLFLVMPSAARAQDYSIVRVQLSIGDVSSLNITVKGQYYIEENPNVKLGDGTYSVCFSAGIVQVKNSSTTLFSGTSVKLKAIGDLRDGSNTIRLYNTRYGTTLTYLGDMRFFVYSGRSRAVNYVYIEDYLWGVVAHEMSNAWPLEALKAQTVAARGYVAKALENSAGNQWDIGDTSSDQVYKGYNPVNGNVKTAVEQTSKIVMKYNNSYVIAYFAASNGGRTESASGAWPTGTVLGDTAKDAAYPYLTAHYDPYDRRNPSSNKDMIFFPVTVDGQTAGTSFTLSNNGTDPGEENRSYHGQIMDILREKVKSPLSQAGYSTNDADLTIKGIVSISNLVTNDNIVFSNDTNATVKVAAKKLATAQNDELNVTVKIDFPELNAIFQNDYRRYYVEEVKNTDGTTLGFRICNVRYGHGVGLSQRGAQQMAKENIGYQDILKFYYTGITFEEISANPPGISQDPTKPGPAQYIGTINASGVNVRVGAGTSFAAITKVDAGQKYEVTKANYTADWHQINYNGQIAYVYRTYLNLSPLVSTTPTPVSTPQPTSSLLPVQTSSPTPTPTPEPTPGPTVSTGTVTADGVNVRAGAGTSYAILGKVDTNQQFGVTKANYTADWHQINYNGKIAYIHSNYLKITSVSSTPPPAPSPTVTYTGVVKSLVNVRSGPGSSYSIYTAYTKGTQVNVTKANYNSSSWHEIVYGNGVAYIYQDYLTLTPVGQEPSQTPAASILGTISASTAYVRSGPGTGYTRLGTLTRGQHVEVVSKGTTWSMIKYGSGTAYVYASYISYSSTPSTLSGVIIVSTANLRSGPGTDYRILATLSRRAQVTVLQRGSSWTKVQYKSITGYVSASFIKLQ